MLRTSPGQRITLYLILPALIQPCLAMGGSFLVTDAGDPYSWDISRGAIPYTADSGPLGGLSNEEAVEVVRQAFRTWQAVPTATISFQFEGVFEEDVNQTNSLTYLEVIEDGINPVVFDDDGAVIDLMLGLGAVRSHLGIVRQYLGSSGRIVAADIVINGEFVPTGPKGKRELLATLVHEVGHFVGLGHSQLNHRYWADGDPSNNIFLPTMFPVQSEDDTSLADLNLDDEFAISWVYPADSFWTSTGGIVGTITRRSGHVVRGASVVARKVDDPDRVAISSISDLRSLGSGGFEIYGLPYGWYIVGVEPIDPRFHGTAAVGPFALDENSASFVNPIVPEFYNGDRESGDPSADQPDDYELVEVELGQLVEVDIIANEEETLVGIWRLHNPSGDDSRSKNPAWTQGRPRRLTDESGGDESWW